MGGGGGHGGYGGGGNKRKGQSNDPECRLDYVVCCDLYLFHSILYLSTSFTL